MNKDGLKKQIELLRLRQQATRLALRLYETSKSEADITTISQWFERCNAASEREVILVAVEQLRQLAQLNNIPIDV